MAKRTERSDAVRNRLAVLAAADRLFAESPHGAAVSMDEIAEAAGVGKGTLFRRFGDRAGLVRAVFEARTEWLRDAVASGPDPLGPKTPPRQRIVAIMQAIVRVKLDNGRLARALEDAPAGRADGTLFESEPYRWIHGVLVDAIGRASPRLNAAWAAHALLATARADLLDHLTSVDGMTDEQLLENVRILAELVLDEG
ncbi:MAG: helix-turn-helix domain containing protein [Nocardiopsaceae bacterium]|nr:helix-turn-helix domain containing protein [Nocardiopsaceae bacterium]